MLDAILKQALAGPLGQQVDQLRADFETIKRQQAEIIEGQAAIADMLERLLQWQKLQSSPRAAA